MKKLNNLEKKEVKAGSPFVVGMSGALIALTSIGEVILNICRKYCGGPEEVDPPPPLLPYSPDSPAAHEQWIKMQEMEQARFNPEYRLSN